MNKRYKGYYCRICGAIKPNEQFSGKGHRNHICKECSRKPKAEINEIDIEKDIFGYLKQSHISNKNVKRLKVLVKSESDKIAKMADIVIEVAKVKHYRTIGRGIC